MLRHPQVPTHRNTPTSSHWETPFTVWGTLRFWIQASLSWVSPKESWDRGWEAVDDRVPKSQLGAPVPLLPPFSFLPPLTDQWGCCLNFPSQVQVMLGITRLDYGRTQGWCV